MILSYLAKWKYSNTPEGERPFEKVIGLTKYGLVTSVGIGIYDCTLLSQTYTFWNAINCMSFWVVPITAMCATFASVTYAATKIRGKDDYANYIPASIATGGVYYKWQKQGLTTYYFTIILMAVTITKKYLENRGFENPNIEIYQQYATFPIDMTLVKDPRGRRPWE